MDLTSVWSFWPKLIKIHQDRSPDALSQVPETQNTYKIPTKLEFYSHSKNYKSFIDAIDEKKIYAVTKFGTRIYSKIKYDKDIFLLFGSETTGLPKVILRKLKNRSIKIPMLNDSRSLNLSNSVAIVVYEVWRQLKFSSADL